MTSEGVRLGRQRSRRWRPSPRLRRRTGIQHPAPHRRQDDRGRTRRPGRRGPAVCHGQQGSDEVRVLHRPGPGGDQRTGESDARSRNVRLDTPRAVQAPSHTVSLILLHGSRRRRKRHQLATYSQASGAQARTRCGRYKCVSVRPVDPGAQCSARCWMRQPISSVTVGRRASGRRHVPGGCPMSGAPTVGSQ